MHVKADVSEENLTVHDSTQDNQPNGPVISESSGSVIPVSDSQSSGVNAVARDRDDRNEPQPAMLDYMRYVQEKSGRGPLEIAREFIRLSRGRGKLTWSEYVQYGVYDNSRHSLEDQSRFITNSLHWPITHLCCDMTWQAVTEDKWLCAHLLAQTTVAAPATLAVIDRTNRSFPGTRKISSADQLKDFMKSQDVLPVFGKENRGICSFGAFLVLDADDREITLKGNGPVGYDAFMEDFVGTTPYLIQKLERNHAFFDVYTDALATVRVCILVTEDDIKIPFTVLKLPSRNNVADSFWRPGNLACDVRPESGEILTVHSKDGLGTSSHEVHPDTGEPILGKVLPMWDQLLELARSCAPIFEPVRYQSMDIALTPDGPVLIEVNTGGGFDLPQLASGRGFLTDEVCEFFRSCGYDKV
jgi:hypothetical protein